MCYVTFPMSRSDYLQYTKDKRFIGIPRHDQKILQMFRDSSYVEYDFRPPKEYLEIDSDILSRYDEHAILYGDNPEWHQVK